mgnify:CR=1 FL=1
MERVFPLDLTSIKAYVVAYAANAAPLAILQASGFDFEEDLENGSFSCAKKDGIERCLISLTPLSEGDKRAMTLKESSLAYLVLFLSTSEYYSRVSLRDFLEASRPHYLIRISATAKSELVSMLRLN